MKAIVFRILNTLLMLLFMISPALATEPRLTNGSAGGRQGVKAKMPQPLSLTAEQVQQINELLGALGEYGEIHLIVQRGELRYIIKVESQNA